MTPTGIRVPLFRLGASPAAVATFTAETALHVVATGGPRPVIPANLVQPGSERGMTFFYRAQGILSSTVTPTYTLTLRLGANASTTASIVLGTAAITTQSTITNQMWVAEGEITVITIGDAGANSTVRGLGSFISAGIASPFMAPFNAAASATVPTVATVDFSIANYFNLNVACSASSASNSIQLLGEAVDVLIG